MRGVHQVALPMDNRNVKPASSAISRFASSERTAARRLDRKPRTGRRGGSSAQRGVFRLSALLAIGIRWQFVKTRVLKEAYRPEPKDTATRRWRRLRAPRGSG